MQPLDGGTLRDRIARSRLEILPMLSRRNVAASLLAVALFRAGSAQSQPVTPSPADAEVRRELDAFRSDLKRAAEARDIAKLRVLITDTFTHTHASGRIDDRDAHIISLVARDPGIEDALMIDPSVRIHGPDMAILTARSPILNRDENKHYDFRWIQVFTRVSGQWQLAASQVTLVQP
jgi:hypothetical protein